MHRSGAEGFVRKHLTGQRRLIQPVHVNIRQARASRKGILVDILQRMWKLNRSKAGTAVESVRLNPNDRFVNPYFLQACASAESAFRNLVKPCIAVTWNYLQAAAVFKSVSSHGVQLAFDGDKTCASAERMVAYHCIIYSFNTFKVRAATERIAADRWAWLQLKIQACQLSAPLESIRVYAPNLKNIFAAVFIVKITDFHWNYDVAGQVVTIAGNTGRAAAIPLAVTLHSVRQSVYADKLAAIQSQGVCAAQQAKS